MDVLRQAFSLVAEYLTTTETAPVKNLMDTGIQLGRRFRALKLWMVLRYFGAAGIRRRLEAHVDLARMFAGWSTTPTAGNAWPRCRSASSASAIVLTAPTTKRRSSGTTPRSWTRSTLGRGVSVAYQARRPIRHRLAIGNIRTEERHIRRAWALLTEAAAV
jgi:aromatic-L-amino-acid decarboxylase